MPNLVVAPPDKHTCIKPYGPSLLAMQTVQEENGRAALLPSELRVSLFKSSLILDFISHTLHKTNKPLLRAA